MHEPVRKPSIGGRLQGRQRQPLVVGIVTALFCAAIVIAPDLGPALHGLPPGYVWTPVNGANMRFGDSYYYLAWVNEVLRHGLPPFSPTAKELAGIPILETIRALPLAVAAIPGLIFTDIRIVYLLDYALTAIAFAAIGYAFGWIFLRRSGPAAAIGIALLFLTEQWWTDLPVAPGVNVASDIDQWSGLVWSILKNAPSPLLHLWETEALQGSFRFINLSVTGPILLAFALLCTLLYRRPRPAGAILLAVFAMAMAFSYPSQAMIAYLLLVGFAALSFFRRRRDGFLIFAAAGAATLGFLWATGYFQLIHRVYATNELWNNIFGNDRFILTPRPLAQMAMIVFINKYVITFALCVALVWRNRPLREFVLLIGIIAMAIAPVCLFQTPQLWGRFLGRGIDHLWFLCILLSLGEVWRRLAALCEGGRTIWLPRLAGAVLLALLCSLPVRGFADYTRSNLGNLTRAIPAPQWQALRWIRGNLPPDSVIAAFDWDDITFLPIYTKSYIGFGNMIIGGRSPQDELKRYVTLWKMLGRSRADIESLVAKAAENANKRFLTPPDRLRHPPFLDQWDYDSSQLLETIVYWPYVKELDGVPIAENGRTTPQFVDYVLGLYDSAVTAGAFRRYGVDYVMLRKATIAAEGLTTDGLEPVFENDAIAIYRVAD